MKASGKSLSKVPNPQQQLRRLIAAFEPKLRTRIRSVHSALRKRFPSANELVYSYPKALVISWSPTERGSDAVVAISAGKDGLRLIFNQGPTLPDHKKILLGSGRQTRSIWVESAKTLDRPEVRAILRAGTFAAKNAKNSKLGSVLKKGRDVSGGQGRLIIK